ncbi:hypothetical protein SFRURICE_009754 [Spodoptera frugiperda]|nr:hypothetical protein SFRURICE_009754 [Spodoptera frugiperda]
MANDISNGVRVPFANPIRYIHMGHHSKDHTCIWAAHWRILRDVVGNSDLSRPALVQAMVRSEGDWDTVTSFC